MDRFKRTFAGTPATMLSYLRPPEAAAVIVEPDQHVLDDLTAAIERALASGIDVDLRSREEEALEQLASLVERPPLFVRNGTFTTPDSRWRLLERSRQPLEAAIAAVGRIEFERPTGERQLGTGFLIGPNLILTNRHVAKLLARKKGDNWRLKPGLRPRIDFKEEDGSTAESQHAIQAVRYVSPDASLDVAVLSISALSSKGERQPAPIRLSNRINPRKDRLVAAIGYPRESDSRDAELERTMLAGKFGVKRIQPGRVLRSKSPIFAHDCTTANGSSGSCIVAIQDGSAVGLHYFGETRIENLAVALKPLVESEEWLGMGFEP